MLVGIANCLPVEEVFVYHALTFFPEEGQSLFEWMVIGTFRVSEKTATAVFFLSCEDSLLGLMCESATKEQELVTRVMSHI